MIIQVDRSERGWCQPAGTRPIVLATTAEANTTMNMGRMRRRSIRLPEGASARLLPAPPRRAARPREMGMIASVRVSFTITP